MNCIPNTLCNGRNQHGIFGTREFHFAILEQELGFGNCHQFQLQQQFSENLIHRLGLSFELAGHEGCVNCIEWNASGTLLASGSDDCTIRIWNLFSKTAKQQHVITTGHTGNIFGVKFLPESQDNIVISCAADGTVRLHDINYKETVRSFACHLSRVKRIATAVDNPFLFWSGGEDGLVLQYDLRVPTSCNDRSCGHVLINLNPYLNSAEVKSIACNPVRTEYLALGATDCYSRLFDRRMLSVKTFSYLVKNGEGRPTSQRYSWLTNSPDAAQQFALPPGCVRYFTPGHLPLRNAEIRNGWKSFAITDIRFSADGSEILSNIGGEQIYLFNINSQDGISKVFSTNPDTTLRSKNVSDVTGIAKILKEQANECYHKKNFHDAVQIYDRALLQCENSSVLYSNRAVALLKRNWDGDTYQSLLDAYKAFLLDPCNEKAQFRVIKGLYTQNRFSEAKEWLEFFRQSHMNSSRDLINTESFQKLEQDVMKALDPKKNGKNRPQKPHPHFDKQETDLRNAAIDYEKRFVGHCNTTTDIKEANFVGQTSQFIMAGSDDGSFFIWDRFSTNLVKVIRGDHSIVNCLQAHPTTCLIATSGIDSEIRIWSPLPEVDVESRSGVSASAEVEDSMTVGMEVEDVGQATNANQRRMNADPWSIIFANWVHGINPRVAVRVPGNDDPDTEGCAQQ